MKIIDGKKLAEKIYTQIKQEHAALVAQNKREANLSVILIGDNQASQLYVKNKMKACQKVGFKSILEVMPSDISEMALLNKIEMLNKDENIDGILVQLPLPKHINEMKVIRAIHVNKDVDGFHPENIGKMFVGDKSGFLPCTPYGIIQMIHEYKIPVEGKDVVIIGRSNIVGKPMAILLIEMGATVQVCNSKTKKLHEKLKQADIIISASGVANLVQKKDVKDGVIVFDVGINRLNGKLCGDVDFDEVYDKVQYITPVPGGVGPMTVASLISNTFKSYKNKFMCEGKR